MSEELRAQSREIESLSGKLARVDAERMLSGAVALGGAKLVAAAVDGQTAGGLRTICDTLRDMDETVVAVLGTIADGKVVFAACAARRRLRWRSCRQSFEGGGKGLRRRRWWPSGFCNSRRP